MARTDTQHLVPPTTINKNLSWNNPTAPSVHPNATCRHAALANGFACMETHSTFVKAYAGNCKHVGEWADKKNTKAIVTTVFGVACDTCN